MNLDNLLQVFQPRRVLVVGDADGSVVENLQGRGVEAGCGDIAETADLILFCATHPNLAQMQAFRDRGFSPDLDFGTSNDAIVFRRGEQPLSDPVLRLYLQFLQQRSELAAAAELQSKVQVELESATRDIEQLVGLGLPPPAVADHAPPNELLEDLSNAIRSQSASLKALNFRLQALEQQNAHLATNLAGITESKIWRTLVRAAGMVQRLFRL
jgi:hypothetical protein